MQLTVNQEAFIDSYLNIFVMVEEDEIKEFFINLRDDKLANVEAMQNGVHILDCWLLWNEAQSYLLQLKQECPNE